MSVPGWYPDPGGAPGQFRYWDGTTWSPTTSPTPGTTPPHRKKPPTALLIGIGAAALVLTLITILLIANPFTTTTNTTTGPVDTSTPTQTSWDETSQPTTPPPTGPSNTPTNPQPTGGTQVNCADGNPNARQSQNTTGKLTGGGLTVNQIPGWTVGTMGLSFAYDVQSQTHTIASGWFNDIAVGALRMADGFDTPQQSAEVVMQCLASSDFYNGFRGRTDVFSKEVTISGKRAWHIRSEIRVTGHESQQIEGDVIDVIVVDTQQGEYLSLYQTSATIGRSDIQKLVDAATSSLAVA
ncbi:DUF2510 domain-containing protein [Propionicicella superfundia]|uniref:DUF2510 domain-containing protein n=1 Tax=Propionicicella superfundia TaxID=348582 RepID=UPI00040CFF4E|nr:DUF2510 domain-containing protein [Propionicicella superfundia]